ncbi:hypothetical protein [Pseudonocardia endophytica]|uniref:Uncharacterized protein n=1 Tax=Pseudonocardia endophytica TaxID=401976 RepID=A0A4R1HSX6_PSEEN|nr:hypothetical protein [Pseudonocardia endophytica]TCK25288.1 hypothetical protein EV378_1092 [Pseudonocardia endophytica]
MSPATVAIVVAVISAVIALTSAIGVEVLRRRANRELEVVKHELAEQRAANDRRAQTAELVRAYRNPLLRAAYDLQSRIWNMHGGFRGRGDTEHDYFVTNTLYVIAEFFGWLEIVRRELQFLDLADEQETGALKAELDRIQGTFASTSRRRRDDFYVYRGQQRAIGELMIVELAEPRPTGVRSTCLGYAAFVDRLDSPAFVRWLARPRDRIADLTGPDLARLVEVQHALIDLIDRLDPDRVRFASNRDKIATVRDAV